LAILSDQAAAPERQRGKRKLHRHRVVSGQAPIGDEAFTNHAYVITPTLAAGKGWGNFDIQASVAVPVPVEFENKIGTSLASNLALQYHFAKYFWPEFEFNDTYWFDGERGGKDQLFLTPGIIFGPFPISQRAKLNFGVEVSVRCSPTKLTLEPLTPMYNHAVLFTSRMGFLSTKGLVGTEHPNLRASFTARCNA
jgi:hypothetical protein